MSSKVKTTHQRFGKGIIGGVRVMCTVPPFLGRYGLVRRKGPSTHVFVVFDNGVHWNADIDCFKVIT
jgi:hypothetical protein